MRGEAALPEELTCRVPLVHRHNVALGPDCYPGWQAASGPWHGQGSWLAQFSDQPLKEVRPAYACACGTACGDALLLTAKAS